MKKIVLLISIFSFNTSYGNTIPLKNKVSHTVVVNKIEPKYRTFKVNYSSSIGDSSKFAYAELVYVQLWSFTDIKQWVTSVALLIKHIQLIRILFFEIL